MIVPAWTITTEGMPPIESVIPSQERFHTNHREEEQYYDRDHNHNAESRGDSLNTHRHCRWPKAIWSRETVYPIEAILWRAKVRISSARQNNSSKKRKNNANVTKMSRFISKEQQSMTRINQSSQIYHEPGQSCWGKEWMQWFAWRLIMREIWHAYAYG
jgi:hypothetical protein